MSAGSRWIAGQMVTDEGWLCVVLRGAGVPSTAVHLAGWAHTPQGAAYVVDAGAAVPAGALFLGGSAFTSDGAAYYTTDTPDATSYYIGGRAYRGDGAMHITGPGSVASSLYMGGIAHTGLGAVHTGDAFFLPFAELGGGLVDTSIGRGIGPASFTRATTASTVGSTGLVLKGIASGTARSRYDPTTLEYQGYFAEGARTNICLQSEDLATTWTNTRSSESVNATTAPDGTATADKLVEDATAANSHGISQVITYTNVIHTFSAWLKAGERTWGRIRIFDGTTTASCYFNLATGTVGTAANGAGTIKAYANGWYRCMLTTTAATAAAAGNCDIYIAEADGDVTFDGDGASGIYVWGDQVEAGSFASSYIPTTTVSVTRNADVLTYPFAGNADATQGWAYAEVSTINAAGIQIGFGTNTASSPLQHAAITDARCRDDTNTATKAGLSDLSTGIRKRASKWGGSTMEVTGDGAAVATATFDGGTSSTAIAIGSGTAGAAPLFGCTKNARIGIIKPTDAQIQAITA